MKLTKTLIFSLLVLISLSSFGQEKLGDQELEKAKKMAQKSDAMMQEHLQLTDEQIPQISEINLEFSKKMVALFKKPGSKFGKIGDVKKNAKDRKAQLKKVLTSEQMKLFEDKVEDKMRKEMRKSMKDS